MSNQFDQAYRVARDAMHDSLRKGSADPVGLQNMQKGMAAIEPHKQAFGRGRYDELRDLLNQVERLPRRVELALVPSVPVATVAAAAQQWQNKLSVDQMIGMFCLSGLLVYSGFNLTFMAYVAGIFAIVIGWRRLYRVAPVTATIIFLFFGAIFLALLELGGGRSRRRW